MRPNRARSTVRWCAPVAALALLFQSAAIGAAVTGPDGCPITVVRGIGPTCPGPDGTLRVILRGGRTILTHGPDPSPSRTGNDQFAAESLFFDRLAPKPPSCIRNPSTDYHMRVLYARPRN